MHISIKKTKTFLALILFLAIGIVISLHHLAIAQGMDFFATPASRNASAIPDETDPFYIAMIFHRFSNQQPNFREMVINSEEYKMTPDSEKIYIIDKKIDELRSTYNLITFQEPIVLETPVFLSSYNEKLGGFLINNFEEGLYIPIESFGKNYAIIPERIIEKQWLPITDKKIVKKIEKFSAIATLKREPLIMSFSLTPVFADAKKPSILDGQEYLLMSVRINSMSLYTLETEELLWRETSTIAEDDKLKDLIKLK